MGKIDVRDICHGRRTIRNEAFNKSNNFSTAIRGILEDPIKNYCIAVTQVSEFDDGYNRILMRSDLLQKSYGNPSHGFTNRCVGRNMFDYFCTNYFLKPSIESVTKLYWVPCSSDTRIS